MVHLIVCIDFYELSSLTVGRLQIKITRGTLLILFDLLFLFFFSPFFSSSFFPLLLMQLKIKLREITDPRTDNRHPKAFHIHAYLMHLLACMAKRFLSTLVSELTHTMFIALWTDEHYKCISIIGLVTDNVNAIHFYIYFQRKRERKRFSRAFTMKELDKRIIISFTKTICLVRNNYLFFCFPAKIEKIKNFLIGNN